MTEPPDDMRLGALLDRILRHATIEGMRRQSHAAWSACVTPHRIADAIHGRSPLSIDAVRKIAIAYGDRTMPYGSLVDAATLYRWMIAARERH